MKRVWLIIAFYFTVMLGIAWAYTFTHTGAEIDQGVQVGLDVGTTVGIIESDGADTISAHTFVTTVSDPGGATNVVAESAIVTYVKSFAVGEVNTGANAGAGAGKVYIDKTAEVLNFKSILAGANITVTNNADTIEISTAGSVGEANTASNTGTGEGAIFKTKSAVDLQFKKIQAGDNVTVTDNGNEIIITSTGGGGTGDVVGPASSTSGAITRYADTTGKVVKNSIPLIDDSGNITNVTSLDITPSAAPQVLLKDSDMPGTDKTIGGLQGQYRYGADGAENTAVINNILINGSNTQVGAMYDGTSMSDGEMRGDFVIGFDCGATITKGQTVIVSNSATPFILADASGAGNLYPAVGVIASNCTSGNPGIIMIKGLHKNTTTYGAFAIGAPVYLSTTAGGVTTTVPTLTTDAIQIIGKTYPDDIVMYDFSRPWSNIE